MTEPEEGDDIRLDLRRQDRIGLGEAVYCEPKSPDQIARILDRARAANARLLLTRLDPAVHDGLPAPARAGLDYDPVSRTAMLGAVPPPRGPARVAIVSAGTADRPVVAEAARTLAFAGHASRCIGDIGVAGLWRLLDRVELLAGFPVIVAVAGMEGAFFSVLAGLVPGLVIAVPSPVGYGVGAGGQTALLAALSSCAPGVVAVNIGNGYGAACAALRVLAQLDAAPPGPAPSAAG